MLRKVFNRIRLSFRNSQSDRSATNSYRDYHKRVMKLFNIKNHVFKKLNKYRDDYKFKQGVKKWSE